MTIAGAVRPFTPVDGRPILGIEAAAGNLSVSLGMQLQVAPLSIVSSSSTPMVFYELQTSANVNQTSDQTYGIAYQPQGNAPSSPFPVSFSVTGMLVNGDVIALPTWLHLLNPNQSFSLLPDRPIYFVMRLMVVSAPPGTYQLAVQETVGGNSYSGIWSLVVFAPVQQPNPP
jgi:hypothetical protein